MRGSRVLFSVVLVATLTVLVFQAAYAATLTPQQQKDVLWQAVDEVLKDYPPEVVNELRAVGVGSWMKGTATKASDIDITLGHPDAGLEREIAAKVQARVDALAGGGAAEHKILVNYRSNKLFEDAFRGEVGQKFFLDYADETGKGLGCFTFYEDDAGKIVTGRAPTERFWVDHNLPVPDKLDGAYRFVEDSLVFLEREAGQSTLVQAQKAAKYLDNIENRLMPQLGEKWGTTAGVRSLSPDMAAQAKAIKHYKETVASLGEEKALERLMADLGVTDARALDSSLEGFTRKAKRFMVDLRDDVEVLERLAKDGTLARAGGPAKALAMRNRILETVLKGAGKALFTAADCWFVMQAYYERGPQAAAEETALLLLMHSAPPAAFAVILADLGREVFKAGVEFLGKYFVFDPINDSALRGKVFAQDSTVNIYTWDDSPFYQLSRQTLCCKFDSAEAVKAGVVRYLKEVKAWNGAWFADHGFGDLTPILTGQMLADWERSQMFMGEMEVLGLQLAVGRYAEVAEPLAVLVNGADAGAGETFSLEAGPKGAVFNLRLMAEFGYGQRIPSDKGFLDKVVCERGLDKAQEWMAANTVQEYDDVRLVLWQAEVVSGQGWDMVGDWPKSGGKEAVHSKQQPWGSHDYRLGLRPGPKATDEFAVRLTLTAEESLPQGKTKVVEKSFVLAASQAKAGLEVTVLDKATGKPIQGAVVIVDGAVHDSRDTSASGLAVFQDLPPGTYRVATKALGYRNLSGQLNLVGGEVRTGKARLIPLPEPEVQAPPEPEPEPTRPEPEPEPQTPVQPQVETPRPPTQTMTPAQPAEPTGQQICDCMNTWNTTIHQAELQEAGRNVNGDNYCGGEIRLAPALTYVPGAEVCRGRVEWWDCDKTRKEGEEWFNSATWEGEVNMGQAQWYCDELKKAGR